MLTCPGQQAWGQTGHWPAHTTQGISGQEWSGGEAPSGSGSGWSGSRQRQWAVAELVRCLQPQGLWAAWSHCAARGCQAGSIVKQPTAPGPSEGLRTGWVSLYTHPNGRCISWCESPRKRPGSPHPPLHALCSWLQGRNSPRQGLPTIRETCDTSASGAGWVLILQRCWKFLFIHNPDA